MRVRAVGARAGGSRRVPHFVWVYRILWELNHRTTEKECGALCCSEPQKLKQNKGVIISGILSSFPHSLSIFSSREEGKRLVSGGNGKISSE